MAAGALAACVVVPTPHRTHASGPHGSLSQPPQTGGITPGLTTREELRQLLGDIEIPTGLKQHFWGRWTSNKWRINLVILTGGAYEEIYRRINLLADFDVNGVVLRVRRISDSELPVELAEWVRDSKPPKPSERQLEFWGGPKICESGFLWFTAEGITPHCASGSYATGATKRTSFDGLELRVLGDAGVDTKLQRFKIQFRRPKGASTTRNLTVMIEMADLFSVVQYFVEHSGTLK